MSNQEKEILLNYVKNNIPEQVSSLHGLSHLERVEKIGHFLADKNGADKEVISLFAYFHDLGRLDNGEDIEHGARSAQIVRDLYSQKLIDITDKQYQQLVYACLHHSITTASSDDITIQTCWDSDRLDLWRDGIEPNPELLFTAEAKKPATIFWAKDLAGNFSF